MSTSKNVCVIIPAAGSGTRADFEKQFYQIAGRPLLCYTIDHFQKHPCIQQIIIATSKNHIEKLKHIFDVAAYAKCTIIEGGETRHRSISNCLKFIEKICCKVEVVIIHDAVRPFLTQEFITNLITQTISFGACGYIRPLVSTVVSKLNKKLVNTISQESYANNLSSLKIKSKLNEENYINTNTKIKKDNLIIIANEFKMYDMDTALDRSLYFNSETPQAFHYDLIKRAYQECSDLDLDNGTECLLLVKKYTNAQVKLLEGSDILWKVTYPKDLLLANLLINEKLKSENIFILNKHEKFNSISSQFASYIEHSKKILPLPTMKELCIASTNLNPSSSLILFCEDINFFSNHILQIPNLNVKILITKFVDVLNSYLLIENKLLSHLFDKLTTTNENYTHLEDKRFKEFNFKDLYILIIVDVNSSTEFNFDIFSEAFHQISDAFKNYGISLSLLKLVSGDSNCFELIETLIFSKRSLFNSQIFQI